MSDANTPNGRYVDKPWTPGVSPAPKQPRWQFLGPFSSNEQRLVQQAIQSAVLPGAEIAEMVRPPIPQVDPFPPRYGYATEQPGIMDVVQVVRSYTDPRITWFSGGVAGYSGTSRNTLGTV